MCIDAKYVAQLKKFCSKIFKSSVYKMNCAEVYGQEAYRIKAYEMWGLSDMSKMRFDLNSYGDFVEDRLFESLLYEKVLRVDYDTVDDIIFGHGVKSDNNSLGTNSDSDTDSDTGVPKMNVKAFNDMLVTEPKYFLNIVKAMKSAHALSNPIPKVLFTTMAEESDTENETETLPPHTTRSPMITPEEQERELYERAMHERAYAIVDEMCADGSPPARVFGKDIHFLKALLFIKMDVDYDPYLVESGIFDALKNMTGDFSFPQYSAVATKWLEAKSRHERNGRGKSIVDFTIDRATFKAVAKELYFSVIAMAQVENNQFSFPLIQRINVLQFAFYAMYGNFNKKFPNGLIGVIVISVMTQDITIEEAGNFLDEPIDSYITCQVVMCLLSPKCGLIISVVMLTTS